VSEAEEDGGEVTAAVAATAAPNFSLNAVAQCRNRVNLMRTDMPYADVSTGDDPVLARPAVIVLAAQPGAELPARRDLFGIIKAVLGRVGPNNGFRLEHVTPPGTQPAQAIMLYNMEPDSAYPQRVVRPSCSFRSRHADACDHQFALAHCTSSARRLLLWRVSCWDLPHVCTPSGCPAH
jgi:hypothetical protein